MQYRTTIYLLIKLARPSHWIKNTVVLMPVVFGLQMQQPQAWASASIAAIAFCFASSFSYILNDIKDRGTDRYHPLKKDRPLPSNRISVKAAAAEAVLFLFLAISIAYANSYFLLVVTVCYILLQTGYTFRFKHAALIDVICIALGFVLRAAGGAVAIAVPVSPWLFICMFTLCLFLGFCKRYNELITINDSGLASNHRSTLIEYQPGWLIHFIDVSAAVAVVSFLFYGLSDRTVANFGTNYIVYTLPITVYALFRFAMLSIKGVYQDPVDLILHDRPFLLSVAAWIAAVGAIILYGKNLEDWLRGLY